MQRQSENRRKPAQATKSKTSRGGDKEKKTRQTTGMMDKELLFLCIFFNLFPCHVVVGCVAKWKNMEKIMNP